MTSRTFKFDGINFLCNLGSRKKHTVVYIWIRQHPILWKIGKGWGRMTHFICQPIELWVRGLSVAV